MITIAADRDILDVDERFRGLGRLRLFPGRAMAAANVRDADALIVRSITPVNAELLAGSSVRFVATATSGTNHLDWNWLAEEGIAVADAAGCNANAVAEYVIASLAELVRLHGWRLQGKELAVVGAGHVGSRLLQLLQALDVQCMACDPPVEAHRSMGRVPESVPFVPLERALQADVISLHVPLNGSGPYATRDLLDRQWIESLHPGSVLINTCRGEVLDEQSLLRRLRDRKDLYTILDVWQGEPGIDPLLCDHADIATPHIAGYSVEAKRAATEAVMRAFCEHFDLPMPPPVPGNEQQRPAFDAEPDFAELDEEQQLARCLTAALSPARISEHFRARIQSEEGARVFDGERRRLRQRREFSARAFDRSQLLAAGASEQLLSRLHALGLSSL